MLQGLVNQSEIFIANLYAMATILDIMDRCECSKSGENIHSLGWNNTFEVVNPRYTGSGNGC
jgi:hypothetical protein